MTWESIGSTSTGQMPEERSWILFSLRLAKIYVLHACGEPPEGCEIGVMWHEHELGSYPTLGISYEDETPYDYIQSAERALEVFDDAVSWHELKSLVYSEDHEEDEEESQECDGSDEDDDLIR